MGIICGVVISVIGAVLVIVISSVGYVVVPGIIERSIINVSMYIFSFSPDRAP